MASMKQLKNFVSSDAIVLFVKLATCLFARLLVVVPFLLNIVKIITKRMLGGLNAHEWSGYIVKQHTDVTHRNSGACR